MITTHIEVIAKRKELKKGKREGAFITLAHTYVRSFVRSLNVNYIIKLSR